MLEKLEDVERRYVELEELLIDPAVIGNRKDFARLAKERADLEEIVAALPRVEAGRSRRSTAHRRCSRKTTPRSASWPRKSCRRCASASRRSKSELKCLLLPKDPNDEQQRHARNPRRHRRRRGGLFAAELFRMYTATPSRAAGASR